MNFEQGLLYVKNYLLVKERVAKYTFKHYPDSKDSPQIELEYPGKLSKGDYKLNFVGKPLSHTDIVRDIYTFVLSNNENQLLRANYITNLLADIFEDGRSAETNFLYSIRVNGQMLNMHQFKELVYWIVLQEDINYPRPKYMGVKLPLIRYIEAAISAIHPEIITIDGVLGRTDMRNGILHNAINSHNISPRLSESLARIN